MYGQHNVRASAEENTGLNTDKGHTLNSRAEIKIPDPAGNRTRAAGLELFSYIEIIFAVSPLLIKISKTLN